MDRKYWDRVAAKYESEIFDVRANDRKGLIAKAIRRCGGRGKVAADLGCGPGKFIPLLSRAFGEVLGVDISETCLEQARTSCGRFQNARFVRMDLANGKARLPRADFALSVNSLLMPSATMRAKMLDGMARCVVRGGHMVLVVPAMESTMLAMAMLAQWHIRDGVRPEAAGQMAVRGYGQADGARLGEGIVMIDGVATKHYLEGELGAMLGQRGMEVLETRKIEYSWETEFERPPRWMDVARPWDWMVVAKKEIHH